MRIPSLTPQQFAWRCAVGYALLMAAVCLYDWWLYRSWGDSSWVIAEAMALATPAAVLTSAIGAFWLGHRWARTQQPWPMLWIPVGTFVTGLVAAAFCYWLLAPFFSEHPRWAFSTGEARVIGGIALAMGDDAFWTWALGLPLVTWWLIRQRKRIKTR